MDIQILYEAFLASTGVSTDTRTLQEKNMFFALSGLNFNGNAYAAKALNLGASFVVVDNEAYFDKKDARYILVNNSLTSLQDLARHHRSLFTIPLIGLTGSNGKTTTKELLAACLSCKYKVHFTQGNFNNHIGVPLTLLELDQYHEIAIIEMGANHLEEIKDLANIALPTHGFITNIGNAHLEGFGSKENILKGKCELYDFLNNNGKSIFYSGQDEMISQIINNYSTTEKVYSWVKEVEDTSSLSLVVDFKGEKTATHLIGSYNINNINAALSIGVHFGINIPEMLAAISSYQPSMNRSQLIVKNGYQYILDAYNANPTSVSASLESFAQSSESLEKHVVLGDMFELGNEAINLHREVIEKAITLDFQSIVLVGPLFSEALESLKTGSHNIWSFKDFNDDFISHFRKERTKEATYLIKGSRSMKMERLIEIS